MEGRVEGRRSVFAVTSLQLLVGRIADELDGWAANKPTKYSNSDDESSSLSAKAIVRVSESFSLLGLHLSDKLDAEHVPRKIEWQIM
jgi:hypothetical protein